jgi:hypothetical protein
LNLNTKAPVEKTCSTAGFYDGNTAVTFFGDSRIDLVDNIAYGAASLDHYMATYGAGFCDKMRGEKREPIILDVQIDGNNFKTKDVSLNGVYIDWVDCDKELGDELILKFTTKIRVHSDNNLTNEVKAGIVRIDNTGVGLAFRK